MIGCRPLTNEEIDTIKAAAAVPIQDRALILLGATTGFRISELLSLTWTDVLQQSRVMVVKRNTKGRLQSRSALLHPEAKAALEALHYAVQPKSDGEYIFKSRKGENRAIGKVQAWRRLDEAFTALGLKGKLGTHCMRKYFAERVYEGTGKDLLKTQRALGHRNINSTISYLSFNTQELDATILDMRQTTKKK